MNSSPARGARLRLMGSLLVILCCFTSTVFYLCSAQSIKKPLTPYEQLRKDFPPGSKFTGDYRGAIQCFGFAGYAFHQLYGCNMPNSYQKQSWYEFATDENVSLVGQLLSKQATIENLEQLMEQARFGDIIQYGTKNYPHTMLLTGYENGILSVYDCNYDNACTVMDRTFSCADLSAEIGTSSTRCGLTLYRPRELAERRDSSG